MNDALTVNCANSEDIIDAHDDYEMQQNQEVELNYEYATSELNSKFVTHSTPKKSTCKNINLLDPSPRPK